MSQYTELLNIKAETLSPDDDGYEESLLKISALFRGFSDALTSFIEEHGYAGDLNDSPSKVQFLREKFQTADIKPPRDLRDWFTPDKKIARKTAFQICFAFGLDIEGTNDFFRCVQLERGFDCHTVSEAVYYFCIKNGFSYREAQEILERIPVPKKAKVIPNNREVLYTGAIIEYINGVDDRETLIRYITDNIDDFQYNNATAIKYIQELWAKISREAMSPSENDDEYNLAVKEGRIIDKYYNRFQDRTKKGDTDTRSKDVIEAEVKREERIKLDDRVVARDGASTWTIFTQIIGLDNQKEMKYSVQKYNRSLTSVLSQNALMPLNASYCFPSQHSIDRILRGELGDNELMRKMLIFLVFYTHWAKIIINKNDAFYSAKYSDSERCLATINKRLLDAGYPELYAGNPYDWLFKWSLNDEHPLEAFRTYMGEVFAVKEEQENCEE